jgi:hypothetical protein
MINKIRTFKARFFLFCIISLLSLSCSTEDDYNIAEDTIVKDIVPPQIFKKLSHINHPSLFNTDICGYEVGGKNYAIIGGTNFGLEGDKKITIVDVTNVLFPVIVSTIPSRGYDVRVWKHYLYVAQGSNVESLNLSQIFDISDLLNPVLVGNFPTVHNSFIDEYRYLYITGTMQVQQLKAPQVLA